MYDNIILDAIRNKFKSINEISDSINVSYFRVYKRLKALYRHDMVACKIILNKNTGHKIIMYKKN